MNLANNNLCNWNLIYYYLLNINKTNDLVSEMKFVTIHFTKINKKLWVTKIKFGTTKNLQIKKQ